MLEICRSFQRLRAGAEQNRSPPAVLDMDINVNRDCDDEP
jgi:hypothetical protein